MKRTKHHIWCNFFNRDPADCKMCEDFEKRYPENKSPDKLLKEHFPDVHEMNKEYNMKDWKGELIKCPKCDSTKIEPAVSDIGNPFDYLKDCKSCGHQFSASPHN